MLVRKEAAVTTAVLAIEAAQMAAAAAMGAAAASKGAKSLPWQSQAMLSSSALHAIAVLWLIGRRVRRRKRHAVDGALFALCAASLLTVVAEGVSMTLGVRGWIVAALIASYALKLALVCALVLASECTQHPPRANLRAR